MTFFGRFAPGLFPFNMTSSIPLAIFGVTALSSKPSPLLITAVALFISPSQKNSSRSVAFAAKVINAHKTIEKD